MHNADVFLYIVATMVSAQRDFTFVLYTSLGLHTKVIIHSCLITLMSATEVYAGLAFLSSIVSVVTSVIPVS